VIAVVDVSVASVTADDGLQHARAHFCPATERLDARDDRWLTLSSYAPGTASKPPPQPERLPAQQLHHSGGRRVGGALPLTRSVFERIRGTPDLLVSMDAVIAWCPWWHRAAGAAARRPQTEGLHSTRPLLRAGRGPAVGIPIRRHPRDGRAGGGARQPGSGRSGVRIRRLASAGDWCPLPQGATIPRGGGARRGF
jgi:hypothetical protein